MYFKKCSLRLISFLVRKTQDKLHSTEEKLRETESNQADRVDKSLLKNLLIGYIMASNNDKQQILKLISSVLDFNQQESDKVGLNKSNTGWLNSILHGPASPNANQSGMTLNFHWFFVFVFWLKSWSINLISFSFKKAMETTAKTVWPKHLWSFWKMNQDHVHRMITPHLCWAWAHRQNHRLAKNQPDQQQPLFNPSYCPMQCCQHSTQPAIQAPFSKIFSTIPDTTFSNNFVQLSLVVPWFTFVRYEHLKNEKKKQQTKTMNWIFSKHLIYILYQIFFLYGIVSFVENMRDKFLTENITYLISINKLHICKISIVNSKTFWFSHFCHSS